MIGLPVGLDDTQYQTVFPNSIENTLYSFGITGYSSETELQLGTGYWLRFVEPEIVTISGTIVDDLSISLMEGWNLISGISETVSIYSISDPEGIIVPFTLYNFNEGYSLSESLAPGRGYWIRTNQSGTIIISN